MNNVRNTVIELAETFVISFVIIMVLYGIIASIEVISGASMEPSFYDKERILVDKLTPRFDRYRRGDIVVFIPPETDKDVHFIKRVIGLPGETVKIFNCKVYVLGSGLKYVMEEAYISNDLCTSGGTEIKDGRALKIPENQYMLLGDNRSHSMDSRVLGLVDRNKILGRVVFRLWPVNRIGFIN